MLAAPGLEDYTEWRNVSYSTKMFAQEVTGVEGDWEWIYEFWVQWSQKAKSCRPERLRHEWNAFSPNGHISGATYTRFFIQKDYSYADWDLSLNKRIEKAMSEDYKDASANIEESIQKFQQQVKLRGFMHRDKLKALNPANIIFVSDSSDKPYVDIGGRGVAYTEAQLAKFFVGATKNFSKTYGPIFSSVAGIRCRPGETLIFEENGLNYYNSYVSREDYRNRAVSNLTTMFFKLALNLFNLEGFISYMNPLALKVQQPAVKINHVLVVVSNEQGIGKNTIFQPIGDFYAPYSRHCRATALLQDWMDVFDEALFFEIHDPNLGSNNQKRYFSMQIKNAVASASNKMHVQIKHQNMKEVDNQFFMVITCNNDDDLYIEAGDRRWNVVRVKPKIN